MNAAHCPHDRLAACNQCRLESLDTSALLDEVFAYAQTLRRNGITPRGWWIELANRLDAIRESRLTKG